MRNALRSLALLLVLLPIVCLRPLLGQDKPTPPPVPKPLVISIIDVGQGDAILVQFPNDTSMLIDAGDTGHGDEVLGYLQEQKVEQIGILVATHPHEDHIGGMDDLLAKIPVGKVWDSGYNHGSQLQQRFLQTIKDKGIQYGTPRSGFTQDVDKVRIEVLAPGKELLTNTESDANNNSLVLRIVYGKVSLLLTGDMEEPERASVKLWPASTVLKVAHHGSANGTDPALVKAVAPMFAAISCGKGNAYGHPHMPTIQALMAGKCTINSTFQDGTIIYSTDGETVSKKVIKQEVNANSPTTPQQHVSAPTVNETVRNDPAGNETVYLTKTGEKFHKAGCRYLARSSISIKRAEAIAKGYTACSVCKP